MGRGCWCKCPGPASRCGRPAGHAHHAVLPVPVGALGSPAGRARAHHGAAAARLALLFHLLRRSRAAPGRPRVPEPPRPSLLRRREPGGRARAGGACGAGLAGSGAGPGGGRGLRPPQAGSALRDLTLARETWERPPLPHKAAGVGSRERHALVLPSARCQRGST